MISATATSLTVPHAAPVYVKAVSFSMKLSAPSLLRVKAKSKMGLRMHQ
jgi:hypothetical protein